MRGLDGVADGWDLTINTSDQMLFTGASGGYDFDDDIIMTTRTPSAQNDTGVAGTILWDASYIYVCTATDYWERVAIAAW